MLRLPCVKESPLHINPKHTSSDEYTLNNNDQDQPTVDSCAACIVVGHSSRYVT